MLMWWHCWTCINTSCQKSRHQTPGSIAHCFTTHSTGDLWSHPSRVRSNLGQFNLLRYRSPRFSQGDPDFEQHITCFVTVAPFLWSFPAYRGDGTSSEAVSEDTLRWNMRLWAPWAPVRYNKYFLLFCLYTKTPSSLQKLWKGWKSSRGKYIKVCVCACVCGAVYWCILSSQTVHTVLSHTDSAHCTVLCQQAESNIIICLETINDTILNLAQIYLFFFIQSNKLYIYFFIL